MMTSESPPPPKPAAHRIAIRLGSIGQLFNSMDPSPFHKQDLDRDAEEFIMSWAQEFPRRGQILTKLSRMDVAMQPRKADALPPAKPATATGRENP